MHGREAPSSDLADWMVGKLFFDQIVENQRQEDALMGGAMEEEEWRTIWRREGGRNEREARGVRLSDCTTFIYVFGGAA